MGAPVFWKGKYFITQRNGIHRASKSKYCTDGKTMTLLSPGCRCPGTKELNRRPSKKPTSQPRMAWTAHAEIRAYVGE